MSSGLEIRIVDAVAEVWHGGSKTLKIPLGDLIHQILRSADQTASSGLLPRYTRFWREWGDLTAVALELPPHAQTVRWIADNSDDPFGPAARYGHYFLAFPWVVILLVFQRGGLSGQQQLYYRRAPLDEGDELLLPNLLNVAKGYGQLAWVCLQHVPPVRSLSWPKKFDMIIDHVFNAAFNRSSEVNEGNSYWTSVKAVDPRVDSVEAWQEASRRNSRFVLDLPWRSAGTTMRGELESMLNSVVRTPQVTTATELAGLVTRARGRSRRR